MILKVAVEKIKYHIDEAYSYAVHAELFKKVKIGSRVLVPFGKGSSVRQGLILEILPGETDESLKKIHLVLDENPLVTDEMLQLAYHIKNTCFCSLFEAFRLILPSGLNTSPEIFYKFEVLNSELSNTKEKEFLNQLLSLKKEIFMHSDLKKLAEPSLISNFLEKGILKVQNVISKNSVGREFESVFLTGNLISKKLTPSQKNVYDFLLNAKVSPIKEVCYFTGENVRTIQSMVKRGILGISKEKIKIDLENHSQHREKINNNEFVLSNEQEEIFQELLENYKKGNFSTELLHGITGSGKTHVILKLVSYVLSLGKSVIFMVPEIALTAQFISIFRRSFGENVAIFHSGLSDEERFREWNRVRKDEAKIAIGTRSAVFAPLKNLGLIAIDEEHEHTYKSEQSPRFHARSISKFRCKFNNCMLLLSSATPSIESYFHVKNVHFLKNRFGSAVLPNVKIIDMNKSARCEIFSPELLNKLKENKEHKKQSVLLMNRRGFNTLIRCRSCNAIAMCPKCNISLNFHKANNFLMCHYCGYSSRKFVKCAECGSDKIGFFGVGTQKISEELEKRVPGIKILRMDADTTHSKKSYSNMFSEFGSGNYDVLLGTQMIAKGLDFPNITLVGVISADQALYADDFRNSERAFSLITQVIGRCGRKKFKGEALIQTYTPENSIIKMAANQDYKAFFESEIRLREAMLYPPFSDLCSVNFSGESEEKTKKTCENFFEELKSFMSESQKKLPLRILLPTPENIKKIAGKYRYKIILKCKNNKYFREIFSEFLKIFYKNTNFSGVSIAVDMNFA